MAIWSSARCVDEVPHVRGRDQHRANGARRRRTGTGPGRRLGSRRGEREVRYRCMAPLRRRGQGNATAWSGHAVHERGLAGSRRSHDCCEFGLPEPDRDAVQGDHLGLALSVDLGQVRCAGRGHGRAGRGGSAGGEGGHDEVLLSYGVVGPEDAEGPPRWINGISLWLPSSVPAKSQTSDRMPVTAPALSRRRALLGSPQGGETPALSR